MSIALRKFMRRLLAMYAAIAISFIGLNSAHIHLSGFHGTGERHFHDAEFHAAHSANHHDNIDGDTEHLTDASFVDVDPIGNLVHGIDPSAHWVLALVVVLLIVPPMSVIPGGNFREIVVRISSPPRARPGARGPP